MLQVKKIFWSARLLALLALLGALFVMPFSASAAPLRSITSYQASNDASNVYYQFQVSSSWSLYRVYIDTDQSTSTGFAVGTIGADYLLENDILYQHTGSGWSWTQVKGVSHQVGNNIAHWALARADIGETATPNTTDLIFQVETSGTTETSSKYTHTFTSIDRPVYTSDYDTASMDYGFRQKVSWTTNRVYIDTDQNASTGYSVGGIGADYKLEGCTLYHYAGGSNWTFVRTVGFDVTNGLVTWSDVPRSAIGESSLPNSADLVFQGASSGSSETTRKYTQKYSNRFSQHLAIPSYFYPGSTGAAYWTQLESSAPNVGLAVINPDNGPGSSAQGVYVIQAASTQAKGIPVFGYVRTTYGARSITDVKADIDHHFAWYGVEGIFVDEVTNTCATADIAYYQQIYNYIKGINADVPVVINPGTRVPECYASVGDIIINFEDTYANYVNWQPLGWEYNYPEEMFWHLIHTTNTSDLSNAIALAKQRNTGWIYVTSDILPNPWDTLPTSTYWSDEINLAWQ